MLNPPRDGDNVNPARHGRCERAGRVDQTHDPKLIVVAFKLERLKDELQTLLDAIKDGDIPPPPSGGSDV